MCAVEVIHAAKRVHERTSAPAKVKLGVSVRWVPLRCIELARCGINYRYVRDKRLRFVPGGLVMIGACVANAEKPSPVLIQVLVEGFLIDGEMRRDALQHPC